MPLDEFTITLSRKDGRLSADTLKKALEDALAMLRGFESSVTASGTHVQWDVVRVKMQSPMQMTFAPKVKIKGRPRPAIERKIVKACLRGVEEIERGTSLPPHISDETLVAARSLVKGASGDGTSLTFGSNGSGKITLTEKTIKHVDEIISKARLYVDFSTIEGRLEVISVHDHNSFFIWETLTNHKVECRATEDQLKDAVQLLLLKKRVAVTGRVSYRNHIPQMIWVEEPIRVLRDAGLPQPKDIGPIDITGGLSSEDHVRRMRNA